MRSCDSGGDAELPSGYALSFQPGDYAGHQVLSVGDLMWVQEIPGGEGSSNITDTMERFMVWMNAWTKYGNLASVL